MRDYIISGTRQVDIMAPGHVSIIQEIIQITLRHESNGIITQASGVGTKNLQCSPTQHRAEGTREKTPTVVEIMKYENIGCDKINFFL